MLWFTISVIVCICMYVLVIFFLFWLALGQFLGKKLAFWFSACSVLMVIPLLLVRPSFPLVSLNGGFR